MCLRRAVAVAVAMVLSVSLILIPTATDAAHNITRILGKHPELSTFNHHLTETHLAAEINQRLTITVCAVDNTAMNDLLSKHLDIAAVKNVLSLHVLLDYYDAEKLHQIRGGSANITTLFQATGFASGSNGFVKITEFKGGKVVFSPEGGNGNASATFVKKVEAVPYNISVIQISSILDSTNAEAPSPSPSMLNLTTVMSDHGCKVFAETLLANAAAEQTFRDNVQSGLTVFCPGDDAMRSFLPKYKNLTAGGRESLLEYHGIPIYQSRSDLRSNNGVTNTLATDGAKTYNFTVQNNGMEDVTIQTKIVTAKIVNTLIDSQPLAIYELDKVLLPKELFKTAMAPTPAPAPAPDPEADADSPKSSGKHKSSPPSPNDAPSESPADAPDGDVADQNGDGNGAARLNGGSFGAVILSFWCLFLQL